MRLLLLLLCAACSTPAVVHVSAAPADGGLQVRFRRETLGRGDHPARITAEGGRIADRFHSPDRYTACVLWHDPEGALRCAFPYGGEAVLRPGERVVEGEIEYVFLEKRGASVTARLPRGCPIVSAIDFDVRLDDAHVPAKLILPGNEAVALVASTTRVKFLIPRDKEDALVGGDYGFVLESDAGREWFFLLTIDPDGTPAAATGFIRNW